MIWRIETDPAITNRLSFLPSPRWQLIRGDELLQSFATADQPAGLIHTEGQTLLLKQDQSTRIFPLKSTNLFLHPLAQNGVFRPARCAFSEQRASPKTAKAINN